MTRAAAEGAIPMPRRAPWWWCPDIGHSGPGSSVRTFPGETSGQLWSRSIGIEADAPWVFAWVAQLRRAPYSYDWADNFGRRSPQDLDPELVDVRIGDSVMSIFAVCAVVPGRSMTIRMNEGWPSRAFGQLVVHYAAEPAATGSRLVVEMAVPLAPGPLTRFRRYLLAWGDLVMMRRQLRELKRLAERDHTVVRRAGRTPHGG